MSSDRRRLVLVVGTRPNFMKMAPVAARLAERPDRFEYALVHTGQHYDARMSDVFLEELRIGEPDRFLGVGSGSNVQQVARGLERLKSALIDLAPDVVVVAGDVNSTLAGARAAAQLGISVAHVEAGLRSFDRSMPEEYNRVATDQIADLLFIHSPEAREHLLAEGRPEETIHYVGNTMIDTLVALRARIEARHAPERYGLEPGSYLIVTLHRPSLVDDPLLADALAALSRVSDEMEVVFPLHPRTRAAIDDLGLDTSAIRVLDPLGYLDFASLLAEAAATLTDSGGIQEEATFLGVPCFTLRDNTERPITVELGTNTVLGLRPERIAEVPALLAQQDGRMRRIPPLWDGRASERIADVLAETPLDASATDPERSRA
jgi:UDP-N-acetylglucosamine 2-epimerase (non-hydrolysing)